MATKQATRLPQNDLTYIFHELGQPVFIIHHGAPTGLVNDFYVSPSARHRTPDRVCRLLRTIGWLWWRADHRREQHQDQSTINSSSQFRTRHR